MSSTAAAYRNAKTLRQIFDVARRIGSPILRLPTSQVLRGITRSLRDVVIIVVDAIDDEEFGAFLRGADPILLDVATRGERRRLLHAARKAVLQAQGNAPSQPQPRPKQNVDAWAAELGVHDLLDGVVRDVLAYVDQDSGARRIPLYRIGDHTVRNVLETRNTSIQQLGIKPLVERAMERAAKLRADAIRDEAHTLRLLRSTDGDPVRAKLLAQLATLREELRPNFLPLSLEQLGAARIAYLDERSIQLVVSMPDPRRWGRPNVSVHFDVSSNGALNVRGQTRREDGAYQLAAIDAMAHFLTSDSDLAQRALADLTRDPWARWLSTLDRQFEKLDAARAKDDDARLWWQLDCDVWRLTPMVSRKGKRGGYLKPKRTSAEKVSTDLLTDPRDVAAFTWAATVERHGSDERGVFAAVLGLVGHPRVLVDGEGDEPWAVVKAPLGVTVAREDEGLVVRVAIGTRTFTPSEMLAWIEEWGLGNVGLIALDPPSRSVLVTPLDQNAFDVLFTMERRSVPVPVEHRDQLFRSLNRMTSRIEVRPETTEAIPPAERDVVCLLRPLEHDAGIEVEVRVEPVRGGALFVPGEGPRDVVASVEDGPLAWARRDLDAERREASETMTRFGSASPTEHTWVVDDLDAAIELVAQLRGSSDVECRWPTRDWRPAKRASGAQLRFAVSSKKDWFQIAGDLQVDGRRVDLAVILEAAREQRRYVRMGDGEFVELEATLLERLRQLEPLTEVDRKRITLMPAGADLVTELGEEAESFDAPERFRALARNIKEAQHLDPTPTPALGAILRPYQHEGYAWMTRLAAWGAGAVLADDMGLGKTLQAIAVLTDRAEAGAQLVVAPTSVCFNWEREIARFAPTLNTVMYGGADRAALLADLGPRSIVIVSYGVLLRDIALFQDSSWQTLVIDEAQAIKNAATKRWKAVSSIDAAWSVALTGTPVENRAEELWSIFAVVFPGLLGGRERFRRRFATPMEAGDARASAALAQTIRPYVLRRTKREVAAELPERTDVVVDVVLSKRERELYEDSRLAAVAELSDETGLPEIERRFRVLAALTKLRQLACHPRLRDPESKVPSAKLTHLMRMLEDLVAEDSHALVFSQFVKHLDLVAEALEASGIEFVRLDGSTPAARRSEVVDRFQSGAAPVFLVSLKAGGTGLNLTAADTVVHLDPWWNPAAEDQATDRAHRIGQKRPVTVYRLVSRGTIEEEILALHAEKRKLVDDLLSGTDRAGRMSSDELLGLMRRGIADWDDDEPEVRERDAASVKPSPTSLAEDFARVLDAEVTRRELSRNTAGVYRRIADRALSMGGAYVDLEAWVAAYVAEVEQGRFPKSDKKFASAALSRLVAFRERRT
ncbi:MAG: DEAD/DEAH box helicase [Deltaproteobacteria bacterium]